MKWEELSHSQQMKYLHEAEKVIEYGYDWTGSIWDLAEYIFIKRNKDETRTST
jgi:hypothetical protein